MNKNIERLIALTASLLEAPARPYMVGDKVVLKEGLGNLRYPERGQIGIVTAVLAEPIYDQDRDAGSNAYRRKLDMKIAVFTENGDLEEFHVDSRRFRLAADVDMARDDQAFSPLGGCCRQRPNRGSVCVRNITSPSISGSHPRLVPMPGPRCS